MVMAGGSGRSRRLTLLSSGNLPSARSSSARVKVAAVHRLTRALCRVDGLQAVCATALDHLVRAVPVRIAAFAVLAAENRLVIAATHGYPIELVRDIRITPGEGIIGSVYQCRVPLRVADVTVLRGPGQTRPRYRTKSFVAFPVSTGTRVLGVVCIADRLDDKPFMRTDVSVLRALMAPVPLAFSLERAREQAKAFARTAAVDPLSGLFNRRYFRSRLEEELQRARRHGSPVGLLMLDIDDFKQINDRFGHVAGDAVISAIADILRRSVRRFDVCARYGGEEFAVVMPVSTAANTASVAERIRQRIEAYRFDVPELADLRVTASIGLSISDDATAQDLVNQSDQALYSAKHAGKNRVVDSAALPLPAACERKDKT